MAEEMIAQASIPSRNSPKTVEAASPVGSRLLQRKCACGGNPGAAGECEECRKKRLQKKSLAVSQPGDRFEQEADRIAGIVTSGRKQTSTEGISPLQVQRAGPDAESSATGMSAPPQVNKVLSHAGQPLETGTRNFMEKGFGYDFSQVRIHTDSVATESARVVNALAYTIGNHIVFGTGQFEPHTGNGRRLLAHELTHVVQQADHPFTPAMGLGSLHSRGVGLVQRQTIDNTTCDTNQADKFREGHRNAIQWVEHARERLRDPRSVNNLLNTHFRLQPSDPDVATVRQTYGQMLSALQGSTNTYHCEPDATCRIEIGRDTNNNPIMRGGYATAHDITFCAYMFDRGDWNFTRLLVHETAHTNPANLPDGPYRRQSDYPGSTPLTNAEAYSDFAGDLQSSRVGLVLSVLGGFAAPSEGDPTWQVRLYETVEFENPVLGIFSPSLGIGLGLIGETTVEGISPVTAGPTALISLLGGFRIIPPHDDGNGGYISLFGGPALTYSLREGEADIGAEAGFGIGYRWRLLDFSVGVGYVYDPTREAGMDHLVTGSFGLSVPIDRLIE